MAQSSAHGSMDIQEQKETFHSFLMGTVWTCTLIAQAIMLLTLAFAAHLGWWAGFSAMIAVGVVIGLVFRLSGVYWAVQVALWALLAIGGLIVPALSGMMS